MLGIKEIVAGGAITLVIGGTAYTVNEARVVDNFAKDTGLSQQQAEEYVNGLKESDLTTFGQVGSDFISSGKELNKIASELDCVNYEYEWESPTLSCDTGKNQLSELGKDEVSLGESYKKLDSDSATKADMSATVALIDEVNADYSFEIVSKYLDPSKTEETKKSNSYNKSILKAAIESE